MNSTIRRLRRRHLTSTTTFKSFGHMYTYWHRCHVSMYTGFLWTYIIRWTYSPTVNPPGELWADQTTKAYLPVACGLHCIRSTHSQLQKFFISIQSGIACAETANWIHIIKCSNLKFFLRFQTLCSKYKSWINRR